METRYYRVSLYTDMGEEEISTEDVARIWQESEAEHTGYTRDVHEIIVEVEDEPTDDEWDNQPRQYLYRVGNTWYSIPEVFQDMRLNLVDEEEEDDWQ
jgi:hypothetical protein